MKLNIQKEADELAKDTDTPKKATRELPFVSVSKRVLLQNDLHCMRLCMNNDFDLHDNKRTDKTANRLVLTPRHETARKRLAKTKLKPLLQTVHKT